MGQEDSYISVSSGAVYDLKIGQRAEKRSDLCSVEKLGRRVER